MPGKNPIKKILSIDGGGLRGIIPISILTAIKAELVKRGETAPLGTYFDLMAGTSTGALIVLALTSSSANANLPFSLEGLKYIYEDKSTSIFDSTTPTTYKNIWFRLFAPLKQPIQYEQKLKDIFGDETLKDLNGNIFIPSVNMKNYAPYYFVNLDGSFKERKNFYIRDVARAATTDPLIFPVEPITPVNETNYCCYVDGGFYANNPGLLAYNHTMTLYPKSHHFFLLSLGTGLVPSDNVCEEVAKWTLGNWIYDKGQSPFLNSVFESQVRSTHQLLTDAQNVAYFRIEVAVPQKNASTLDNSPNNLATLDTIAKDYVDTHKQEISKIVDWLLFNPDSQKNRA